MMKGILRIAVFPRIQIKVSTIFVCCLLALVSACAPSSPDVSGNSTPREVTKPRNMENEFKVKPSSGSDICKIYCDENNPSYKCLFMGALGSDRDAQIKEFISRLIATQPVAVPHVDLIKIFGLQGAGYDQARGSTLVSNNKLTNTGESSSIKTQTTSGLEIFLKVPSKIEYEYMRTPTGFDLSANSNTNIFQLIFDDSILHGTYGGKVRNLSIAGGVTTFTTENGCVAYYPQSLYSKLKMGSALAKTLGLRLDAERGQHADSARLARISSAYSRIGALKEEPCTVNQEKCPECGENEVPCKTELGTTCVSFDACKKSNGKICGTN